MKKRSLILVLTLLMVLVSSLAFAGAMGSEEGILSDSQDDMLIADNGDEGGNGDDALNVELDIGDSDGEGGFGNTILYIIIGAVVIVVIVAVVSMTNSNKNNPPR